MNEDLQKAIDIIGSQSKLSKLLVVHKSNISQWKKAGIVPMKHCVLIEQLTGIPRNKLNPAINWSYFDYKNNNV